MGHFYASIQGNRGEVSRMGTANSGITGHIRGWDIGGRIFCGHDPKFGDYVDFYLTSGSNGHRPSKRIGRFFTKEMQTLKKIEDGEDILS